MATVLDADGRHAVLKGDHLVMGDWVTTSACPGYTWGRVSVKARLGRYAIGAVSMAEGRDARALRGVELVRRYAQPCLLLWPLAWIVRLWTHARHKTRSI
jgi:hypothetical protein